MAEQMDMFHERKIAQMPSSAVGKVVQGVDDETVENMLLLLASIHERTPAGSYNRDCLSRAMGELGNYLGREDIVVRRGA
jgi:hypothetical protein